MTATGFAVLLFDISASVGSDGLGLLTCFVGLLLPAPPLVAVGVRMADDPTKPIGNAVTAGAGALAAFVRRNLAVAGLAMASSAVTAVTGDAGPKLCFSSFALFLLGMSLIIIGVLAE
ncbi:hypothetical protein EJB05_54604, partial [Eragrostis curvula]